MNLVSSVMGKLSPKWKTLDEFLVVYESILNQRDYHKQTLKNHSSNLKHIKRIWGKTMIKDIKPYTISTDLKQFLPDHSSTAGRVLTSMKDIFTEAIANGWTNTSPAAHVRQPKHSIIRKRMTLDQFKLMLEFSKDSNQEWLQPMLLLGLITGQRRADIGKMKFSDITDGYLYVEQQKKAGKKHGARVAIPLSLRLESINISLSEVVELCKTTGDYGDYLLRTKGGKNIEISSLSTRFNECIRAVLGPLAYKDREWPSLHELRSLAAREYEKQGIDVQALLGHKSADMTAMYKDDRGLTSGVWNKVSPDRKEKRTL